MPATDCGLRYYWALYEADQQKYAVTDGNGEHPISGALAEHNAVMAGGPVKVDTAGSSLVTPTPGSTRRTFQLKDVPDGGWGAGTDQCIRAVWAVVQAPSRGLQARTWRHAGRGPRARCG